MPAKRRPKPKQIGTSDYCRICGCFDTSVALANYTLSVKLQRIFFFCFLECPVKVLQNESWRTILRDLSFHVSQTEYQSCSVCSPCSNQVRSTRTGPSFIKASFQDSENDDDSFRFLKNRMSASPHGSAAR